MIKDIVNKIIGIKKQDLIRELTENKKMEPEVKTSHKLDINGYKFKRIQMDLLYLPSDNGYKYLLVAVDNFSGLTDAIPLKYRNSLSVRKGIEKIFKNGILEKPKILQVDSGSEFKGDIEKYMKENNIILRRAGVNRHKQQSVVEARNKTFGSVIMRVQLARELESGKVNKKWVKILPHIIKEINNNLKKPKKIKPTYKFKCIGSECDLLNVGDMVRYKMDYPTDFKGKRLSGNNFRVGDVKYSLKPKKIVKVLLAPDMPVRYGLEGITNYSFSKNQLKLFKNKIIKKVEKKKKVNKPKEKWVDRPVEIKEGKRIRKPVNKLGF